MEQEKKSNVTFTIIQWVLFFIILIIAISMAFGTGSFITFIPFTGALFFIMPPSGGILEKKIPKMKYYTIRLLAAVPFFIAGIIVTAMMTGRAYTIVFKDKPPMTVFSTPYLFSGKVTGRDPLLKVNDKELQLDKKKKFNYRWDLAKGKNSISFTLFRKQLNSPDLRKQETVSFKVTYTDKKDYDQEKDRVHRIELMKARYNIKLPRDISTKDLEAREKLVQKIIDIERKYNVQLDKNMSEDELIEKEKELLRNR